MKAIGGSTAPLAGARVPGAEEVDADTERAARRLVTIASRVHLLAGATPLGLHAEIARLVAAWSAGREEQARLTYAPPPDLSAERAALERAKDAFRGPLGSLYADRAEEIAIEAAACEVVGEPSFHGVVRARYPRRDAFDDEADRVARAWSELAVSADPGEKIASDDGADPRSLLARMRRAAGEHRLPFRVVVSRSLAPLAATGERVLYVAAGRRVTAEVAARTVLHEVLGHALPTARAAHAELTIFRTGTRFGSDDQEGRAVLIEERADLLGDARRRELGLRHLAARAVEGGADFPATVRLLQHLGSAPEEAVRIAVRVHRGGGLAREITYIPAFLRARAAFGQTPALEDIVASGRVAIDAARALFAAAGQRAS